MGAHPDPLSNPAPLIRRVYAYAAYHVGAGAPAEDVTSETLERAVRYRASYDPKKAQPVTWLLGIARRVIADTRKPDTVAAEADDTQDGTDLESTVVERVHLEAALGRLGERDRDLLTLRYAADLSARQIGLMLSMETHAVEVALSRALGRMRQELEASDVKPTPVV